MGVKDVAAYLNGVNLPKRGYFAVSRSSVGVRFDNLSNIPEEA